MNATFALFTFLAASLAAVEARPQPETFDCIGKADGIYPVPNDNKGFGVCMGERFVAHIPCGEGKIFDENLKRCVNENGEDEKDDDLLFDELASDEEEKEIERELISVMEEDGTTYWPEDGPRGISKYKVYNVRLTKNVFPESLILVGKANREQKNK